MEYSDFRILTEEQLKNLVKTIAAKINAPESYFPTFNNVRGDATPNIEIIKDGYYFVISERGNEYDRRYTALLDELLFWIFDTITFQMALEYESINRIEGQDCRILIFKHQMELMKAINPDYFLEIQNKAKRLGLILNN